MIYQTIQTPDMLPLKSKGKIKLLLILMLVAFVTTACAQGTKDSFEHWVQRGNIYYAEKQYDLALQAWIKALNFRKDVPDIFQKIGNAYLKQAQYLNALEAYQHLIKLKPEAWDVWLQVAKIQLNLMDLYAAQQSYRKFKDILNTPESLIFSGDLFTSQGNFKKAEIFYEKALKIDKQSQKALLRLAVCLLGQNKDTKADVIFTNIQKQPQQNPEILEQMSNYCRLKNNMSEATSYLIKAIKIAPHNIPLQIKLAELYIENKNYRAAIKLLKNLLGKEPHNRFAKKMLIETMLTCGRLDDAQCILKNLSKTEEKDLEFLLLKGKYALIDHDFFTAISHFQMVLRKEPKLPIAHYFLALSYLAGGQSNLGQKSLINTLELNPNFSEAELALADTYYKTGDYEEALEHAIRIQKREPENFRAHLIAGNIYLILKKYNDAIEEYHDAQLLYPSFNTPAYSIVWAEYLMSSTNITKKSYQLFHSEQMRTINETTLYARILTEKQKSREAINFLRNKIRKEPKNYYLYYILGEIYLATGNNITASNYFEKTLNFNPEMQTAFLKLFNLYSEDDNKLKSILLKAIATIPCFPEAQIALAQLYNRQGEPQKAINLLKNALAAKPSNPLLNNNLSCLYLEHQPTNINEAMRLAQIAYEQSPDNAAILDTLGLCYLKKNMNERATWLFNKAHEIEPDNHTITIHRTMLPIQ